MPDIRTPGLRGRLPVKPPAERFAIQYLSQYLRAPLPAPAYPIDVTGGITEWGMLGYFAGSLAGEERPVITGDIGRPDLVGLKHIGAAAATSGGVELYHIPGITPEAPTLEAAFGPAGVPGAVRYGPDQRSAVYADLNSCGTSADVDFVLLGCPHAS